VYTTSTSFILLPWILFAFTNWAASSKTAVGMSSIVWPYCIHVNMLQLYACLIFQTRENSTNGNSEKNALYNNTWKHEVMSYTKQQKKKKRTIIFKNFVV
jgi:hypothetical protein